MVRSLADRTFQLRFFQGSFDAAVGALQSVVKLKRSKKADKKAAAEATAAAAPQLAPQLVPQLTP